MNRTLACIATFALMTPGCLEPLVDDEVVRTEAILPAGSVVPSSADDPVLLAKIRNNDFVDGDVVPLRSGFADGEHVRYWDFGTAPDITQPMYILVRKDPQGRFPTPAGNFEPIGHPAVWNVVPGDAAYSPFWRIVLTPVTDAYAGELLTSFDAVHQAVQAGLIDKTIDTTIVINCPVVAPGTRLELPDGSLEEPGTAYYRGFTVAYLDAGLVDLDATNRIPVGEVYALRREGGELLDESVRGVDLTGDGDTLDTNNVFRPPEGVTTHLFRTTEVVVGATYASIDTNLDEAVAQASAYTDLFDEQGLPRPDTVRAVYPGTRVCNRPIAR